MWNYRRIWSRGSLIWLMAWNSSLTRRRGILISLGGAKVLFHMKARNSYETEGAEFLFQLKTQYLLFQWRLEIPVLIEGEKFLFQTEARNSCIIWRRGIFISLKDAEFLFHRKARYSYFTWSGWWNVSWIIPAAVSVSSSIYHFTNMEEPLSIETYFRLRRWLAGAYRLFRLPFYVKHVWNTSDILYLKNQDLQTAVLSFWSWGSVRKKRND